MAIDKLSVTIITGFLGAGKTTVLNHILGSHRDAKFAIIENEFGSESVDGKLVAKELDPKVFDLSNGCICCDLSINLIDILKELLNPELGFTHLLIETTGIADPAGVIKPFLSDPVITQGFQLDAVVCVADARIVEDVMTESREAIQQISLADFVIINKLDTIDKNYLSQIESAIVRVNSFAQICYATKGKIDTDILNSNRYSSRSVGAFSLNYTAGAVSEHIYQTESVELTGYFDYLQLKAWLQSYCFFNQRSVLRMKGFLYLKRGEVYHHYTVQSVRDSVSFELYDGNDLPMTSNKLVVIGKDLKINAIVESLGELILS